MDVELHFKAGGSFVRLPPQFSANSENVYVAWKNLILGYNAKTGSLFAEFKGLRAPIVGFSVHYLDSYECITACSASGEVITWKIVTLFKILNKTIDIAKIKSFHVVLAAQGKIEVLVSHKQAGSANFYIVELHTDTRRRCNLTINGGNYHIDVCQIGYVAVTHKHFLHIISLENVSKTYKFAIDKSRQFTCVVCHPKDEIILTGDNTGRVLVWQNLFSAKAVNAVFHWHTLPVKCIAFSCIGSHFYSGGDESVLVRWQIDNPHEKKFLPRLPSTISQIRVSPNNTFIAISTDDNAVRIVDSMFNSVSLIQHLVIGNNLETGILFDPRTKTLIMNGNVGQMQFYSPRTNSLLCNVEVVGQNKVTSERNCKIENTQVVKVAISKGGLWMATVELRRDVEFSSELRLKFWNFEMTSQNFKLSTCVEDPHENCVNAVRFQPAEDVVGLKCVSVGGDNKFKVWWLDEAETVDSKSFVWRCLCVGFYHDLPCKNIAFAMDGSLVAVTFNDVITTWLPSSCHLKCSLSDPLHHDEINQLEFGTRNQCHLVVSASNDRLNVWNLLTLTMIWTVPLNVSLLIADAITANMAVITRDKRVFVFAPISPEPIFSSKKLLKKHNDVVAAVFVPSKYSNDARMTWYQRCPIFVIDSKMELFCLGCEEEIADNPSYVDEITDSLYSMTLPQTEVNKSRASEPVQHLFKQDVAQKNLKKYLEAPIQTMIPIRLMCGYLLRSMVLQKNKIVEDISPAKI